MIKMKLRKLSIWAFGFAMIAVTVAPQHAQAVDVQRVISANGIEAWLVEDTTNPITTIKVSFRGGSATDPADQAGLSRFVAATIDEGAGDLDSEAFQGALEEKSISLSFSAGLDTFRGTLRTLNKNRDAAFDLLRLALTEPRFDETPVERVRAQLIASIRQKNESPNDRAAQELFAVAFPDHSYGRSSDGTEQSVAAISPSDLTDFVNTRMARDNIVIGVVGDIDSATLAGLLDKTFGGLPEKSTAPAPGAIEPNLTGAVRVIDTNVPQSAIQFAQPGLDRHHDDFFTAYVLNYIVGGGGFVSRLYKEVREERGLVYSVYSYALPLEHSATIMGGAGTANERVSETLEVVRAVWADFAENGPTEDELRDAKTYLTGAFPLRFTSSSTIADMLVSMQLEDLGIDYMDRRNGYIEAVTFEDAQRVAKSLYQPDKLTFVIAGKPVGVVATE